jgi:PleD family two-component response regulator
MSSMNNLPSVLVVCDLEERAAFTEPLRLSMATGGLRVLAASDPQDAVLQFSEHYPEVVVVSATLREGDSAALIESVRAMVGRAEVAVVIVGDLSGPVTSALDAVDLGGDRFVSRPLAAKALRYAVAVSIDAARLARGGRISSGAPHEIQDDPTDSYRQAQRARWARLADSIADSAASEGGESGGERWTPRSKRHHSC